jgi:hypothetical protein
LEERTDENRRLMRVAIHPKFARKSSEDFWREVQRLFSSRDQKIAVQKWFPDVALRPSRDDAFSERRDVIRRFSYILDRNFAVMNHNNAPKASHVASPEQCGEDCNS